MKIKILPKKDLKKFWKIQFEYLNRWTFSYLKEQYLKYPNLYIGCYKNKELIGIAYGFIRDEFVILQGIAVKYEIWRKGIGSKILKFFEKQAKQTGMKIVSVGSAEGFVEKFYLKNKYKPVEIQAKGENHFLFAKEKVRGYKDGLKRREKLRKRFNPKEVIFIMNKKLR